MINLKNAMLPVARYKHTSELLKLKRLRLPSAGENAKQQGFLYTGTTTLDNNSIISVLKSIHSGTQPCYSRYRPNRNARIRASKV